MEKVQVTKEVYEALKCLQATFTHGEIVGMHADKSLPEWCSGFKSLYDYTTFEIAEMLIKGYEDMTYALIYNRLSSIMANSCVGEAVEKFYHSNAFKGDSVLQELWQRADDSVKDLREYIEKIYNLRGK